MIAPKYITMAAAETALKDRKLEPLLDAMEHLSAAALADLSPLVFDVIRSANEGYAAMALKRMLKIRPEWANETLQTGDTALMEAVWFSKANLVAILLGAGAKTDPRNSGKMGALDAAAVMTTTLRTQTAIANVLLDNGTFTRPQKDRALCRAAACGNLGMTRSLLAHGAGFGATSGKATALATASRNHEGGSPSVEIVRAMLATDAGLAVIDKGWGHRLPHPGAPAHCAAYSGNVKVLSMLLAAGAAVNAPPGPPLENNYTPLMAASHGLQPETMELLIKAGSDAGVLDCNGANALHHLASSDYEEATPDNEIKALNLLVQAGADPFVQDNDGQSPLDLARENGWHAMAGALAALVSSSGMRSRTPHPDASMVERPPRL